MRKVLISLAAAGTALAVAAPASAQYYPQTQGYGYGSPYGNPYAGGYGYNNYGQTRMLQARIDRIQHAIRQLDRSGQIRDRSADSLRRESRQIEQRLRYAGSNGLNPYEANDIQQRINRLEQRVNYAMNQRFGRGWGGFDQRGYGNGYGYDHGQNYGGYYQGRGDHDDRDDDDDDDDGYRGHDHGGHDD